MATESRSALQQWQPKCAFFVGVDSDGCAFNSMEVKHNDSFSVNLIKHFGLQAVSRQAHQAWDFVNLYSQTRCCNRFRGIVLVCDLLRDMARVKKAGIKVPELPHLRAWMKTESQLGNPTLKQQLERATGPAKEELTEVYAWSLAVNQSIEGIVHHLPPFPAVRADVAVLRAKLADLLPARAAARLDGGTGGRAAERTRAAERDTRLDRRRARTRRPRRLAPRRPGCCAVAPAGGQVHELRGEHGGRDGGEATRRGRGDLRRRRRHRARGHRDERLVAE
jgi:hypothetical protein